METKTRPTVAECEWCSHPRNRRKGKEYCDCHECIDCGEYMGYPIDYADDSGYSYDHTCKEEDLQETA